MLSKSLIQFSVDGWGCVPSLLFTWGQTMTSLVAQTVKLCLQCGRPRFDPWFGKILWRRKWQPTPVLLPGKSHGQKSVVGYSPWGHQESDMTERLHFLSYFLSLVNHVLSELSTMTRLSWVALHSMAHSFTELDKAVVHVIRVVSFL